mgnify:CR=1 FL=1
MTTPSAGASGAFNIKIVRLNPDGSINYNVNKTINYGCTADEFKAALNSFNSFSPYKITVTRELYDGSNNIVADVASSTKIGYIVSFYKLRTAAHIS